VAGWTGLEPAASGVTGRRYNQLNYHPKWLKSAHFIPAGGARCPDFFRSRGRTLSTPTILPGLLQVRRPGYTHKSMARPMIPPAKMLTRLRALHPDAHCELDHATPFQLLAATVMSAQTTDVAVNKITPALFAEFPDAEAMARATPRELEDLINRIGMFRQKAKNLIALSALLVEKHKGHVPQSLDALVALPGVGRKTANVVLGVIFNAPEGVVVDTHVQRISQRLGWSRETEPVAIEADLSKKLPKDVWNITSHTLIFHGRRVCFAQKPNCEGCAVSDACPSAFKAENIGRKNKAGARKNAKPASKPAKKLLTSRRVTTKAAAKKATSV
jgi:endonuclease III